MKSRRQQLRFYAFFFPLLAFCSAIGILSAISADNPWVTALGILGAVFCALCSADALHYLRKAWKEPVGG